METFIKNGIHIKSILNKNTCVSKWIFALNYFSRIFSCCNFSSCLQMLDPNVLTDLEELTLCSYCKQKYNDSEQCPKYLSCKHFFCLRCIENNFIKGRELFCAHCWKRTELGDQGPDALPTHSALLALANNFSHLKINTNNTSVKNIEKERKVR